jgi:predicted RNase H-like HicB family nuclease
MSNYIAIIHKERDSDYGVSFPDFPGCISAGKDLDEARAMAQEALALHIEGMVEDGEAIPEPSSLENVMNDENNRSGVAVLVPAPDIAEKVVRINVTMPEGLLRRIDERAANRSRFLAQAAERALANWQMPRSTSDALISDAEVEDILDKVLGETLHQLTVAAEREGQPMAADLRRALERLTELLRLTLIGSAGGGPSIPIRRAIEAERRSRRAAPER